MAIRIAILDLYNGQANQGMRCIRSIIEQWGEVNNVTVSHTTFEVRQQLQVPDTSYDLYISSGGPGSPLDSEGCAWEILYFNWLQQMETFNSNKTNQAKKYIFFICHSFQLACRYYAIGNVCKRKSTSFGVFPVHMLPDAADEKVFEGLSNPFYAVDSRDYQVIEPNTQVLQQLGAHILCIEKERPHVPLERAIMAARFNECFFGTQFHPEADAIGMHMYLLRADKKQAVIAEHSEEKWQSMVEQLQDPDKIMFTYAHILPNFLNYSLAAINALRASLSENKK